MTNIQASWSQVFLLEHLVAMHGQVEISFPGLNFLNYTNP